MTKVIFRGWMGDIIALFPRELDSVRMNRVFVSSYQHIGQHGGADLDFIIEKSVPATPEDYADLLKELRAAGHNDLVVGKRVTTKDRDVLNETVRKYLGRI